MTALGDLRLPSRAKIAGAFGIGFGFFAGVGVTGLSMLIGVIGLWALVHGLIAQGRTISETIEIARDVAKKLIEAQEEQMNHLVTYSDKFDYPLVIGI